MNIETNQNFSIIEGQIALEVENILTQLGYNYTKKFNTPCTVQGIPIGLHIQKYWELWKKDHTYIDVRLLTKKLNDAAKEISSYYRVDVSGSSTKYVKIKPERSTLQYAYGVAREMIAEYKQSRWPQDTPTVNTPVDIPRGNIVTRNELYDSIYKHGLYETVKVVKEIIQNSSYGNVETLDDLLELFPQQQNS